MKNGWGLSTMIVFCSIIGICLIFSIVMYKSNVEEKLETNNLSNEEVIDKTYLGLEEDVALYSKEYFNSNEDDTVSIKKLIELGYMEPVYDLKNKTLKCSGYVVKTKVSEKYNYNTYLKCGDNYETAGYLESLDK